MHAHKIASKSDFTNRFTCLLIADVVHVFCTFDKFRGNKNPLYIAVPYA